MGAAGARKVGLQTKNGLWLPPMVTHLAAGLFVEPSHIMTYQPGLVSS